MKNGMKAVRYALIFVAAVFALVYTFSAATTTQAAPLSDKPATHTPKGDNKVEATATMEVQATATTGAVQVIDPTATAVPDVDVTGYCKKNPGECSVFVQKNHTETMYRCFKTNKPGEGWIFFKPGCDLGAAPTATATIPPTASPTKTKTPEPTTTSPVSTATNPAPTATNPAPKTTETPIQTVSDVPNQMQAQDAVCNDESCCDCVCEAQKRIAAAEERQAAAQERIADRMEKNNSSLPSTGIGEQLADTFGKLGSDKFLLLLFALAGVDILLTTIIICLVVIIWRLYQPQRH